MQESKQRLDSKMLLKGPVLSGKPISGSEFVASIAEKLCVSVRFVMTLKAAGVFAALIELSVRNNSSG